MINGLGDAGGLTLLKPVVRTCLSLACPLMSGLGVGTLATGGGNRTTSTASS